MFLLNCYDFQLLSFQELNDEKLLKKLWNMKKPNACSRTRALARFLTKQKMFSFTNLFVFHISKSGFLFNIARDILLTFEMVWPASHFNKRCRIWGHVETIHFLISLTHM